jgi:uncharacterized protein YkwD
MRLGVLAALFFAGCASGARAPATEPYVDTAGETVPQPAHPAPRGPLTVAEARAYMVTLINLDRASMGLPPVELDEGPATRAGQSHADDMATRGFLGHWGTDGSVPEERMTRAGGDDMVLENASCFVDEKARVLDRAPLIDPKNVEKAEEMFFNEPPGHDGHRRNILKPWHRKVGIGISQPVPTATEIPVPCFAQEFVDDYGSYAQIPHALHIGDVLHVEGTVDEGAAVAGVGLARVDAPANISVAVANQRRSYPVPEPYQLYWPPGYRTPVPLDVKGQHFSIDVPVTDGGRPGMYELSVWAKLPGVKDFVMVGLRTIDVR